MHHVVLKAGYAAPITSRSGDRSSLGGTDVGRRVGIMLLLCLAAGVAVLSRMPDGGAAYAPPLDQAHFTTRIDNPYLPITPGTRWVYEGPTDEGFERKVVEVTA